MPFRSTKTFGNDRGYSCAFRQWRAESHCRFLHGYALGFHFEFEAKFLDDKNWVFDFGATGDIKEFLGEYFDHTTVVAEDDPAIEVFRALSQSDVLNLKVLPKVGCEAFAEFTFNSVFPMIDYITEGRVRLVEVKVFEHQANAARYWA